MEKNSLPKLVNPEYFVKKTIKNNKISLFSNILNINVIILIFFLVFLVFFLINCKYGIFKNIDLDPVPYSMIK
jgi:hypothetical protein